MSTAWQQISAFSANTESHLYYFGKLNIADLSVDSWRTILQSQSKAQQLQK